MKEKGATISRRGFLKGAAVLGGAATMSTLSPGVVADTQVAEKPASRSDGESQGYHVTPHILEYYEKARF